MASKTNLQIEATQNAANQYVSDNTKQAKQTVDSFGTRNPYATFSESNKTRDAYNYWQSVLQNRPEDYQSQYSGTINNLLNQIVNREDFSYDFNADPLYQQYKDQYTTQGKQAMKDTVAQTAALTGGYGNSYATTAGSQAYQGYLQQLNNKIPELYQQAMNKYQMETDQLNNKFNAVGSQEDREFGQWNAKMGIWQGDRDYGLNAYSTLWNQDFQMNQFNANNWNNDRNYAYGMYRDYVGDDQNAYSAAYKAAYDAQQFDYQQGRDAIGDDHWNKQFEYQKERDRVADEQWAREFALKQAKAARSGGGGSGSGNGQTLDQSQPSGNMDDAYNYVKYIMNNTTGERGEYAAIGNLYRMQQSGQITGPEVDSILKQLGLDENKVDKLLKNSDEWMQYL